jgi:hypothetical protein
MVKLENRFIYDFLFSGLIQKTFKGDFAEDDKLKVNITLHRYVVGRIPLDSNETLRKNHRRILCVTEMPQNPVSCSGVHYRIYTGVNQTHFPPPNLCNYELSSISNTNMVNGGRDRSAA